ncbi:M15 family metallopeptidase [Catenovulum sp. 2E275]|uniref:M15 family metallopeptidase n=1 Tax=Catenovulum sp. 2E275 TaxID=2980497 RepID=UPI0021D28376|nr:M15 family metallopeptidase [Catenovulum sp. 2E275]MCU4674545.1 M15 family metallopeptidase [Catenovulum sp. 2E275]
MFTFNNEQLTGKSQSHLIELYPNHLVHIAATKAVKNLQQASQQAGFDLRLASSFRSFERQKTIWNNKASGLSVCLDKSEKPLDIKTLSGFELADSICFYSAIPGASRHHWGCDFDVYDFKAYANPNDLKLTQAEYQKGGENYQMYLWLVDNAEKFDFIFPFTQAKNGVAAEPWHISYQPLSKLAQQSFSADYFASLLKQNDILLADVILKAFDYFYPKYIGQYHV